jgi:Carboxypeptidase regulatory-like domain
MSSLRVRFPKPCGERWEAMAPSGCNRHCETCDKTIFDLAQMTIGEVETLIETGEELCVRAQVNEQGHVALRSDAWRDARRMIATVGAGLGLMTSGAAVASPRPSEGAIAGKVEQSDWNTHATATSTDGKTYSARVKSNGRYKIKHLPPGTYKLSFTAACSEPWEAGTVTVADKQTATANTSGNDQCIVVGVLEIEKSYG